MRCPLCQKIHVYELEFATLFSTDHPCRECLEILKCDYHEEIIPHAGGIIRYRYLIDQQTTDYDSYLVHSFAFAKTLDMALSHNLVIILETHEFTTMSAWFSLLSSFGSILAVSITRFDIAQIADEIP